jgi:hypothetical protein
MAERGKHEVFKLWYYFDIDVLGRGKKRYKKFPETFFLSTFISIAVHSVLGSNEKIKQDGQFSKQSNCLYMRTKQPPLAYRAPGSDLPPNLSFQNFPDKSKGFQVGGFFGGGITFCSPSSPPVPSFLRFFSDFFSLNSCTILPYPFLKTVK